MNIWYIIIPVICAVFGSAIIFHSIQNKRSFDKYIKQSFGSKTRSDNDIRDRIEVVSTKFEIDRQEYSQNETIDNVTWNDLDMYDIFKQLNHTDSYAGEQTLYAKLHILNSTYSNTVFNEDSIEYFQTHETERTKVRKILHNLSKSYCNYRTLDNIMNIEQLYLPFRFIYPALTIISSLLLIIAIATFNKYIALACLIAYLINLVLCMIIRGKFEDNINTVSCIRDTICAGDAVNKIVPTLSNTISNDLKPLRKIIKLLSILSFRNKLSYENNDMSLMCSYLYDPLMLDFIAYNISIRLLARRQSTYLAVHQYLGEIDCAISTASYRKSLDYYCIPSVAKTNSITFDNLYHPLLDSPVSNSITFKNAIFTGSNASGKSTFIKTIAVNLILGQTIYTCTANNAIIPNCNVVTSMAVRDDINSGESYYIKEVKYLKRMVDDIESNQLSFFAIDEILKGTNTTERIAASKAVLNYFNTENCMLAVATHDIEIAEYFKDVYENYHFCEKYDDSGIVFDYKLNTGICRTSNAIKLLEIMDYPDTIVMNAKKFI